MALKSVEQIASQELYSNERRKKLTPEERNKMRKRDNEMVRGLFKNLENPGETLVFDFNTKKKKSDLYQICPILSAGEKFII